MGVAVSGATTLAAATDYALFSYDAAGVAAVAMMQFELGGLTPGSNVFTSKYRRDTGGTATFYDRRITVVGVP
jgi:hypothetical protein